MVDNKVYIGFITYEKSTAKYLQYFLPSIFSQTNKNFNILALDNSKEQVNENQQYLKEYYPEIEILRPGSNVGFAKGFNQMIRRAYNDGADYFLALNPDMIFESNMIDELLKVINIDDKIGAVMPKILKWDFENNKKTNFVDSYGLIIDYKHRFFDDMQGEVDSMTTKEAKEIFGFTGAAVMLNFKALKDVVFNDEYFDELMFMYKEDCDLSYRLRLAGWKTMLAPLAVAYHDRTASIVGKSILQVALNRKNKNRQLKKWSFLNQIILLYKIKNLPFSFKVKFNTYYYLICSVVFAAIFEPYLIKELFKLRRLLPEIKKRRNALRVQVDIKEIEKFMNK